MPIELLPIMIPALAIVAVAVRLVAGAAAGGRTDRSTDTVLDLRDPAPVDRERLRPVPAAPAVSTTTSWTVAESPLPGGTLGARLRSAESVVVLPPGPAPEPVLGRNGRVVIGRRRAQPLVAQR